MESFKPNVSYNSDLAEKLGVNAAVILGRILWSINKHIELNDEKGFYREGKWWMYDTIPALMEYSTLGRYQVLEGMKLLKDQKIVSSKQFGRDKGENQNYYSIDMEILWGLVWKPDQGGSVRKPDQGGVSPETRLTLVRKPDIP